MFKHSRRSEAERLSRHRIQSHEYQQLSLEEAHEILPMVKSITHSAVLKLKPVQAQLHCKVPADPRNANLRQHYQDIVTLWAGKIERLGFKVHGLWQVGFDGGEGWYCWQYPERSIRYFLEYDAEFTRRSLIRAHLTRSGYELAGEK